MIIIVALTDMIMTVALTEFEISCLRRRRKPLGCLLVKKIKNIFNNSMNSAV